MDIQVPPMLSWSKKKNTGNSTFPKEAQLIELIIN